MRMPLIGRSAAMHSATVVAEAKKLRWYHCLRLTPEFTTPVLSGFSPEMPGWENVFQSSRRANYGECLYWTSGR